MNFTKIRLIFGREMRDQIRDRRTLFMIAVLPLLFYPLLGVSFFQIAQFLQEEPLPVLVVWRGDMKDLPRLFKTDKTGDMQFDDSLFAERKSAKLLKLKQYDIPPAPDGSPGQYPSIDEMRGQLQHGKYQAVLYFDRDFSQKLADYRTYVKEHVARRWPKEKPAPAVPAPIVICDNRQSKSQEAGARATVAMTSWKENVGANTLEQSNVNPNVMQPFDVRQQSADGKEEARIDTSLWSKVLPFVLLIWAVTGAFYPAIDLCAGEKERGTLETLLSSPAQRGEIVMGKLLTVMVFSIITAVLNLVSMGVTGFVVMKNLGALPTMANVGPPPLASLGWLVLILIPVSALFSAVCLALAAFARSTKEGQYYLMPVILVTMPLILLPMAPSAELDLGSSLIPVSGIVLLMRSTMEGTIGDKWPLAFPVMLVTFGCCWLAIRWAVDQFCSESVLFREGERWDLSSWLRSLVRDRQPTPSVGMAAMCGVLILVLMFFAKTLVLPGFVDPMDLVSQFQFMIVMTIAVVALPAIIMALAFTRAPAQTLLLPIPLRFRSVIALSAAPLLAILLFPTVQTLGVAVQWLYPLRGTELLQFENLFSSIEPGSYLFWLGLGAIALCAPLCEEVAFRGFILSGLRHQGHKWRAIIFSALFFGVAHSILQQSIVASLLGCVLAYIAVQSGSLWPGVLYHITHNGIVFLSGLSAYKLQYSRYAWLQMKLPDSKDDYIFTPGVVLVTLLASMAILYIFSQFSYERTREEALQERVEPEAAHWLAS